MELSLGSTTLALVGVLAAMVWWKYRQFSTSLDHIPGPKGHPLVGNALEMSDYKQYFKYFFRYAKEFGPIYKFRILNKYYVVVSDLSFMTQILLDKGNDFTGRHTTWRIRYAFKDTGVLFSSNPDETWKKLRKISHRHLKQFGEGMTRLQEVVTGVAEDMFETFESNLGKPIDPKDAIRDISLKSIALFIIGRRCRDGDRFLERMRLYEPIFMKYVVSMDPSPYSLIDVFPWMRHFMPGVWRDIQTVPDIENLIWSDALKCIREHPEQDSLAKLLMSFTSSPEFGSGEQDCCFTETDAKQTCLSLILAGFSTTSSSFHATVNLLAHNKRVQDKMAAEIARPREEGQVTLADRPGLDYCRATVYEVLRHFTVLYGSVPRESKRVVEVAGYKIPKVVSIFPNLWTLHHDEAFWGDPDTFRPERFLDDDGFLVPADHPNRKHLLPFSAGPRVCLGESLALARLFLWTTNLVQRYEVTPAPGNDVSLTKGDNYIAESILYSPKYSVIFTSRKFKSTT